MAAFHSSLSAQESASVASFGSLCSLRSALFSPRTSSGALSSIVICRFLGRPRPLLGVVTSAGSCVQDAGVSGLGTTISGTSGLFTNLGEDSGSAVGGT